MVSIKVFLFVKTPDRMLITMSFPTSEALLATTTNHHQLLITTVSYSHQLITTL